jgi:hypothetical protein
MPRRGITPGAILLWAIAMSALSGTAQTGNIADSRRLCVVAVRDSSLFTLGASDRQRMPLPAIAELLPPQFFPEGPDILERPRPDWNLLARTETGICPSDGRIPT